MSSSEGRRVCAVIVHHRGRDLLARCLRSLLASVEVDLEIVIVANDCRESLPELHDSQAIHVVPTERALGFSAANNLGAAWAREHLEPCDHLFFVNNDTLVDPGAMGRLAQALGDSDRAVAGPRLMIWGGEGVLNSLGLRLTRTGEAWDEGIGRPLAQYEPLAEISDVLAVTGAALMIRREVFEALGGWEDLYTFYFEDLDLCLRARSHGYRVAVVTTAVVHHAISATAARGSDLKRQLSWRNRFLLMAIHWPPSLLVSAGIKVAVGELRLAWRRLVARAWHDLRLQIRSWLGAVRRWPAAWSARRSLGSERSWTEYLAPHGSVPVISLPELPEEALLEEDGSA